MLAALIESSKGNEMGAVANKMEEPRERDCLSLWIAPVLHYAFIHAASHDAALWKMSRHNY
jgi:hypothetical protein